ncbi:MAG: hypothetical protein JEZ03_01765, partial [Bacteroidales bacterium]|nr:hypothetical protein [Bacteroidales bacterium]
MGYKYLVVFICLFLHRVDMVSAQQNHFLQREVNIDLRDAPLSEVLKLIEQQTEVVFSYTATEINDQKPVTLIVNKLAVEKVLKLLFDKKGKIAFSVINQHIILSVQE